jgi:2,6-dihydroxypyridine 3-monooxygenase
MPARPRALIVGGSLGGLTAALVLRDVGCEVEVLERSRRPLTGRGVGIVAHPATIRYPVERGHGDPTSPVSAVRYLDRRGAVVAEEETEFRFTSYYTLYSELLGLLGEEDYHLGHEVVGFDQDDQRVIVELADGRRESCDLLVCADGIHSRSRRRLLPNLERTYAGYVGWRGVVDESEIGDAAAPVVADALVYCVIPHSHILSYPIPGAAGQGSGERTINWVWYRNVSEGAELDDLLIDANGVRQELSLAPGAVQPARIEELRRVAAAELAPQLASVVRATTQPFLQVVFDVEVPRMAFGRVCLIGDAACALRPHVAAGTAKAAEAAWLLAAAVEACEHDITAALARWEPEVLALEHGAVARTRTAGIRVQFDDAWSVGDPIPFGLREPGDSAIPSPPSPPAITPRRSA